MGNKVYRGVLVTVLVISLALIFLSNASFITGHATETSTTSQVTIQQYLAIDPSINLTNGIVFEDIATLPMVNDNATGNYNGSGSSSLYYINVSTDSNTNVTFCIKANGDLQNLALDAIGLANETYASNVTTSDISTPAVADEVSMTTTHTEAASNIGIGEASYWRFWLDVPAGQATGTYNNSVSFKAVNLGTNC